MCIRDSYAIEAGESATAGLAGLILTSNTSTLKQQLKINKDSQILIIGSEGVTDRDIYNKIVTNELLSET